MSDLTPDTPTEPADNVPQIVSELSRRWSFSRDNQTTSAKSVAAVASAMLVNLLCELDPEQLQAIAGILTQKLGLPVAVVSGGVALFEFWRNDK